jgi:hypothetical protein
MTTKRQPSNREGTGGGAVFLVLLLALGGIFLLDWSRDNGMWALLVGFIAGILLMLFVIRKLAGAALRSPFLWGILSFFIGYRIAKKLTQHDEDTPKKGKRGGGDEDESDEPLTLTEVLRSQNFNSKEIRSAKDYVGENFADASFEKQVTEALSFLGSK